MYQCLIKFIGDTLESSTDLFEAVLCGAVRLDVCSCGVDFGYSIGGRWLTAS